MERSDFFTPYQVDIIQDTSPKILIEKSRRIGVSFAMAYKTFRSHLKDKQDTIVCSSNWAVSKEFLKDIKRFAEACNIACEHEVISPSDMTSETVYYPNGSKVVAISSSPKAF